ncbi:MAG: T9SS type A sorting domain-containing protein [Gemmatimonadetes bacterium]|nr:T9SS type A sorting domain-containing protein [Gemmatimonadota bacterium]
MSVVAGLRFLPLVALGFSPAAAGALTLAAGIADDFQNGPDFVAPSASLVFVLGGFGGVQNYDLVAGVNGSNDRQVAHTFTGLTGIGGATLEIRIRGGLDSGVINDGIFLSFVDSPLDVYHDEVAWRRSFGPVAATLPAYPQADPGLLGAWAAGDEVTLTLNLASLPTATGGTVNLVPMIASRGFLDVNVSDDSGVDYAVLHATPPATDAPSVAGASPDLEIFPNPFRAQAQLRLAPERTGAADLAVLDVQGRVVRVLWRHDWGPVAGTLRWDGRDDAGNLTPSGVYWVRLKGVEGTETRKVTRLR